METQGTSQTAGSNEWKLSHLTPPWEDRPSIYEYLTRLPLPDGDGPRENRFALPDDEKRNVDAVGIHFWPPFDEATDDWFIDGGTSDIVARMIYAPMAEFLSDATDESASEFYSFIEQPDTVIDFAEPLMAMLREAKHLDHDRILTMARWLLKHSPDTEPARLGACLLGLSSDPKDLELVMSLAWHEQFAEPACVAVCAMDIYADPYLWRIARGVTGYGRVYAIKRLREAMDPQIRAWVVREGCRSMVPPEYHPLLYVEAGGLIEELRRPEVDEALLDGAARIMLGLVRASEAYKEGIHELEDPAGVAVRFVAHLLNRPGKVPYFLAVEAIYRYMRNEEFVTEEEEASWMTHWEQMINLTHEYLNRRDWAEMLQTHLRSRDEQTFIEAAAMARGLNIDIWEYYLQRTMEGHHRLWHFMLQTESEARLKQVFAHAEKALPLAEITSGPDRVTLDGGNYAAENALIQILERLRKNHGTGWPLIRAGLKGHHESIRQAAATVLGVWPREFWPAEAEAALRETLEKEEQYSRVIETIQTVIDGGDGLSDYERKCMNWDFDSDLDLDDDEDEDDMYFDSDPD
jgi:hypothetical protein